MYLEHLCMKAFNIKSVNPLNKKLFSIEIPKSMNENNKGK